VTASWASSVHSIIDPQLEGGETFEKYALSSKWGLQDVLKGLLTIIPFGLEGIAEDLGIPARGFFSSDKVGKATLLALTNRRLVYSKVNLHSSQFKTWISPFAGSDEPMNLPLSEIRWAYYQKGNINSRLTLCLSDDSPRVFYFSSMDFGQLAEEIAELINAEKEKP